MLYAYLIMVNVTVRYIKSILLIFCLEILHFCNFFTMGESRAHLFCYVTLIFTFIESEFILIFYISSFLHTVNVNVYNFFNTMKFRAQIGLQKNVLKTLEVKAIENSNVAKCNVVFRVKLLIVNPKPNCRMCFCLTIMSRAQRSSNNKVYSYVLQGHCVHRVYCPYSTRVSIHTSSKHVHYSYGTCLQFRRALITYSDTFLVIICFIIVLPVINGHLNVLRFKRCFYVLQIILKNSFEPYGSNNNCVRLNGHFRPGTVVSKPQKLTFRSFFIKFEVFCRTIMIICKEYGDKFQNYSYSFSVHWIILDLSSRSHRVSRINYLKWIVRP
jgi:hypothetical protein